MRVLSHDKQASSRIELTDTIAIAELTYSRDGAKYQLCYTDGGKEASDLLFTKEEAERVLLELVRGTEYIEL